MSGFSLSDPFVSLLNNKKFESVARNPLIIGFIITVLVFLIAYFVAGPHVELVDDSTKGMIYFMVTISLYTFIGVTGILWLHTKVIHRSLEKQYGKDGADNLVTDVIARRKMNDIKLGSTTEKTKQ